MAYPVGEERLDTPESNMAVSASGTQDRRVGRGRSLTVAMVTGNRRSGNERGALMEEMFQTEHAILTRLQRLEGREHPLFLIVNILPAERKKTISISIKT